MAKRPNDGGGNPRTSPNQVTLKVVVAGKEVDVTANRNAPLQTVIPEALRLAEQPGQNPNDWQLALEGGEPLDLSKKIEDFNFPAGVKLYLNRKAGAAGVC